MKSKAPYEFFAGGSGAVSWTKDPAQRKPVWTDAAQGTHRMAVSYNPALKRYLLTTITHTRGASAG